MVPRVTYREFRRASQAVDYDPSRPRGDSRAPVEADGVLDYQAAIAEPPPQPPLSPQPLSEQPSDHTVKVDESLSVQEDDKRQEPD